MTNRLKFTLIVAAILSLVLIGVGAQSAFATRSSFGLATAVKTEGITSTSNTVAPSGASATAIAAGGWHTCALTNTGGAKCWGNNRHAQLGDGTTNDHPAPADVSGLASGVLSITAGWDHNCALTSTGGIKCWGYNVFGALGDGTTTTRSTPVGVGGLSSGVKAVAARWYHTCALTDAGGVKCWGANVSGQLGDNTTTNRLTPVNVIGLSSGVQSIALGWYHTCALTSGNGVKCWGSNSSGQLGDGTTTTQLTPVDVSGLTSDVIAIAAGDSYTCALMSTGGVKCWGSNAGWGTRRWHNDGSLVACECERIKQRCI